MSNLFNSNALFVYNHHSNKMCGKRLGNVSYFFPSFCGSLFYYLLHFIYWCIFQFVTNKIWKCQLLKYSLILRFTIFLNVTFYLLMYVSSHYQQDSEMSIILLSHSMVHHFTKCNILFSDVCFSSLPTRLWRSKQKHKACWEILLGSILS